MSNLSDYKLTISTNDDLSLTGNITANNITVSSNVSVQGNLSVTGTQTITNTSTLTVNDNKVTLNSGQSGTPSLNASVVIDRGSSADTELRWNESTDKWEQTRDGSTYVTIPINTTELSEGTNQYFTNARARTAISVTGSGSYDNTTGVITVTGGVTSVNTLTGAVTLSTTNISEGTNLYYTDSRANTAFDNKLATKSTSNLTEGTNLYYTDARANTAFDNKLATKSTSNLTEGTNLYYTDTRANTAFDARLAVKSTSNVAEGTNLYFTNARANSAMAAFTGNLTAGNASVTANISGGNLSISGISTVTGNITGGNIVSGGVANITGNITGANLIAGSSGQGNVYAGNVFVNGQPTTYGVVNPDYINAGRRTSDQTSTGNGSDIIFNSSIVSSGISLNTSTGVFTLTAGKRYRFFAELSFSNFSSVDGFLIYDWVDATTNTRLDTSGVSAGIAEAVNRNVSEFNATSTTLIYTPTTNQTVKVRIVDANGTATIRADIGTKAIIEQINPTIAVQATATGTVSATVVANTSPVSSTNFNGGSSVSPALTILTLAIPSAGTWRLDAEMRVYIPGEGYMAAAFYDNGTLISGSEYFIAAGGVTQTGAATGQYSGFMSYNLTTTGATTVTMGAWATGTSQFISSGDGRTWARATQIDSIFALNTLATMSVTGNVSVGGILSSPQQTKASNATGTVGQICWDANYIYVCTATNTWKRSPLTGGY